MYEPIFSVTGRHFLNRYFRFPSTKPAPGSLSFKINAVIMELRMRDLDQEPVLLLFSIVPGS